MKVAGESGLHKIVFWPPHAPPHSPNNNNLVLEHSTQVQKDMKTSLTSSVPCPLCVILGEIISIWTWCAATCNTNSQEARRVKNLGPVPALRRQRQVKPLSSRAALHSEFQQSQDGRAAKRNPFLGWGERRGWSLVGLHCETLFQKHKTKKTACRFKIVSKN